MALNNYNKRQITKRITFLLFILLSICISTDLSAQTNSYILHTIKEGETLSAIAKANKTTVGDIMRLNGMNTKSRLTNGQIIKIPTPSTTDAPVKPIENTPVVMDKNLGIPAKPTVAVQEKKVEVPTAPKVEQSTITTNTTKYTVVKGDNLYKLSKQLKLSEAQLMQMNGMKDDKVKIGQVLIITQSQVQTPKPVTSDTTKLIKTVIPDKPQTKAAMPAPMNQIKKDVTIIDTKSPMTNQVIVIKKDSLVAIVPKLTDSTKNCIVKKDSVLIHKSDSSILTKQVEKPKPLIIEQKIVAVEKPMPIELLPEPKPINKNNKYVNDEGYFASYFNRKAIDDNQAIGDAGTFKTASGWEDKKYYILINGLLPGTIVRVTSNNKSICAKVLAGLPEIKQDSGYLARLNNAAVAALGIEATKFPVTVNHE